MTAAGKDRNCSSAKGDTFISSVSGYTLFRFEKGEIIIMPKTKNKEPFDPHNLKPEDMLKFEIATELGLSDKVIQGGWRSLTAKESGRIGGLITKRKRELKNDALGKELP